MNFSREQEQRAEDLTNDLREKHGLCTCRESYIPYYKGGKKPKWKQPKRPKQEKNATSTSTYDDYEELCKKDFQKWSAEQDYICLKPHCNTVVKRKKLDAFIEEFNSLNKK
jgi:hypothetical protein